MTDGEINTAVAEAFYLEWICLICDEPDCEWGYWISRIDQNFMRIKVKDWKISTNLIQAVDHIVPVLMKIWNWPEWEVLKGVVNYAKGSEIDGQGNAQEVSFESLNLDPRILKGVHDMGFIRPTPIQAKAIPLGSSSRM